MARLQGGFRVFNPKPDYPAEFSWPCYFAVDQPFSAHLTVPLAAAKHLPTAWSQTWVLRGEWSAEMGHEEPKEPEPLTNCSKSGLGAKHLI